MKQFSLHELACVEAVVSEGGFHAAAEKLHRSHTSVFTAVKNLEEHLGLQLFDRGSYRVTLTEAGRAFHQQARTLLKDADKLHHLARHLGGGGESDLRIAVGAVCPPAALAALLKSCTDGCDLGNTSLHLQLEAIGGPWERLFDEEVDLVLHPIDLRDQRLESIPLFSVEMVPVVAPGLLDFPVTASVTPQQMRPHLQCVIRDTSRRGSTASYFVGDGARIWTVSDQAMKKELILHGLGWGHMPRYAVERELASGALLSIAGEHFKVVELAIAAARLRQRLHGPVAQQLWQFLQTRAMPALALADS